MDDKNKKVDFFGLGVQYVKDYQSALAIKKDEIKEKYGEEALFNFELGVAAASNGYDDYQSFNVDDLMNIHGTKDFGIPNTRNNSYFGGIGIGVQVKNNGNYNDPEKGKGK